MCEIKFGAKLITDSNTSYKAGIDKDKDKSVTKLTTEINQKQITGCFDTKI